MATDMNPHARVMVAGHRGLVGSALVRRLDEDGFSQLLLPDRSDLDLRSGPDVQAWFARHRPEYVFVAAGTVGGIVANSTRPAEFIYDNLQIAASVIHAAHLSGVRKLLYLASGCVYPRDAPQPMSEEALLTGPPEPTNEPYAVAKIAGVKLVEGYRRQYGSNFISVVPANLYGPNDNFDPKDAHVIPALIGRFHRARALGESELNIWGSGTARRDFLYVDDAADACLFLMRDYSGQAHINVGTGEDISIRELAEHLQRLIYPAVKLVFDRSKPDGAPRKLLDVSRIQAMGWRHRMSLRAGLASTYAWMLANAGALRGVAHAQR